MTFVSEGLAKVLQINNICSIPMNMTDGKERLRQLSKCGVASTITTMKFSDGKTDKIYFPTKLSELNSMFTSTYTTTNGETTNNPQKNINTNAAAFETKNGETIAVFYNPYCQEDMNGTDWYLVYPSMCANFVYDLNGKKGPNKVGKDIGFITALYPTDSEVVAPMPLEQDIASVKQTDAAAMCRKQDDNSRLPNIDELSTLFYNKQLIGIKSYK